MEGGEEERCHAHWMDDVAYASLRSAKKFACPIPGDSPRGYYPVFDLWDDALAIVKMTRNVAKEILGQEWEPFLLFRCTGHHACSFFASDFEFGPNNCNPQGTDRYLEAHFVCHAPTDGRNRMGEYTYIVLVSKRIKQGLDLIYLRQAMGGGWFFCFLGFSIYCSCDFKDVIPKMSFQFNNILFIRLFKHFQSWQIQPHGQSSRDSAVYDSLFSLSGGYCGIRGQYNCLECGLAPGQFVWICVWQAFL